MTLSEMLFHDGYSTQEIFTKILHNNHS